MSLEQQVLFQAEESLPVVSPARMSRWLANVPVLPENVPAYIGKLLDSWKNFHLPTLSSKTYPVFCHLTEDKIWEPLSGRFQLGGTVSAGECLTLNTSESPSVAVECSLSDILETENVAAKYSLSAKACQGILRRAGRRSKTLPPMLEQALLQVSSQCEKDPQGGGKGPLISSDISLTLATGNNQVLFGQTGFAKYSENEATTLSATTYKRAEDNVVVREVQKGAK